MRRPKKSNPEFQYSEHNLGESQVRIRWHAEIAKRFPHQEEKLLIAGLIENMMAEKNCLKFHVNIIFLNDRCLSILWNARLNEDASLVQIDADVSGTLIRGFENPVDIFSDPSISIVELDEENLVALGSNIYSDKPLHADSGTVFDYGGRAGNQGGHNIRVFSGLD